ncbi:MAG: hypothetical protein NTW08_03215 [Gammaproteobacteria bacterium]|nr:hypothetical protein [Gammaproteobacteria bacterium]
MPHFIDPEGKDTLFQHLTGYAPELGLVHKETIGKVTSTVPNLIQQKNGLFALEQFPFNKRGVSVWGTFTDSDHPIHLTVRYQDEGKIICLQEAYNAKLVLTLRRQFVEYQFPKSDSAFYSLEFRQQMLLPNGTYLHTAFDFNNILSVGEYRQLSFNHAEGAYHGFSLSSKLAITHPFSTLIATREMTDPNVFQYHSRLMNYEKAKKNRPAGWFADMFDFMQHPTAPSPSTSRGVMQGSKRPEKKLLSTHGLVLDPLNPKINDPKGGLVNYAPTNRDHILPDVAHLGEAIRVNYPDGSYKEAPLYPLRYTGKVVDGHLFGVSSIRSAGRLKTATYDENDRAIGVGELRYVVEGSDPLVFKPEFGFDMFVDGKLHSVTIFPDTYATRCIIDGELIGFKTFVFVLSNLPTAKPLLERLFSSLPYGMYRHLMGSVFPEPQHHPDLPPAVETLPVQCAMAMNYRYWLPEYYAGGHTATDDPEIPLSPIPGYQKPIPFLYEVELRAINCLFRQVMLHFRVKQVVDVDLYAGLEKISLMIETYLAVFPRSNRLSSLAQHAKPLMDKKYKNKIIPLEDGLIHKTYHCVQNLVPKILWRLMAIYELYQSHPERWRAAHWQWALDGIQQILTASDAAYQAAQVECSQQETAARKKIENEETQAIQDAFPALYAKRFAAIQTAEETQRRQNENEESKGVSFFSSEKRMIQDALQARLKLKQRQDRVEVLEKETTGRNQLLDDQRTLFQGIQNQTKINLQAMRFKREQLKVQQDAIAACKEVGMEEQSNWVSLKKDFEMETKKRILIEKKALQQRTQDTLKTYQTQTVGLEKTELLDRQAIQSLSIQQTEQVAWDALHQARIADQDARRPVVVVSAAESPTVGLPTVASSRSDLSSTAGSSEPSSATVRQAIGNHRYRFLVHPQLTLDAPPPPYVPPAQEVVYGEPFIPAVLPHIFFEKYAPNSRLTIPERVRINAYYQDQVRISLGLLSHDIAPPPARLSSLTDAINTFASLTGGWMWRMQNEGDVLSRQVIETERRFYHPHLLDTLPAPAGMTYKDLQPFAEFCQDYFYHMVLDVAGRYQLPLNVDVSLGLSQCSQHLSACFGNAEDCAAFQDHLFQLAIEYLETPVKVVPEVAMGYRAM